MTGWSRNRGFGLYRHEYLPDVTDRHYGATAPLNPLTCGCSQPGAALDETTGEVRCWKCGRQPPTTNRTRRTR
jgi:hypothetical protein